MLSLAFCTLFATFADIDPVTTRWTFGAHEPLTMYRRVGNHCTGGIDGNAVWVKDWLDWFDAHAPEKMEQLGLNFLHARFYKGMGWEVEKKDFPNVKRLVANCHAHGVRALAYVQFCTLYPEFMRQEIPSIDKWASVDWQGRKNLYGGQYFRWAPCLNCRDWEEYLKRMCTIALTEGGFDGIMFDNVFDYPCYCDRCQAAFRAHLAKMSPKDRARRFGFVETEYVLLPRIAREKMRHLETKDPVFQTWALWRCETMNSVMMRLRDHIKAVKADAIVAGNPSPYRSRARFIERAQNMAELCEAFDLIIMQNANYPEEIFLRNHVPYGYLISTPTEPLSVPEELEVLIVPGLVTLSDAQIEALVSYAQKGGRIVVTGDAGRYDSWNAQRRANALLPRLKGLANVVVRASPDMIEGADLNWRYTVNPPKDGGAALMADLVKVGWRPPVQFEGLPPHTFVEYRRLVSGACVAHLVNYRPEEPVRGARLLLRDGASAFFEEPFAVKPVAMRLGENGSLPPFGMYAVVTLGKD